MWANGCVMCFCILFFPLPALTDRLCDLHRWHTKGRDNIKQKENIYIYLFRHKKKETNPIAWEPRVGGERQRDGYRACSNLSP
jgi:hypothetical protein